MSQLDADSSDDDTLFVSRFPKVNSISSSDDEVEITKKKVNNIISDESSNSPFKVSVRNDAQSSDTDNEHNALSNMNSFEGQHTEGKSSKIKRIVDSSDEENISKQSNSAGKLFKNKDLFDAESSDEEIDKQVKSKKKIKKKIIPSQLCADSSDENIDVSECSDDESKRRHNSDSSDDERQGATSRSSHNSSLSRSKDEDNEETEHNGSCLVKTSKERTSKSSALSEIRSETQRLMRESPFELPYHRPKQRTLDEFLNRKKGISEVVCSIKEKSFSSMDESRLLEREKRLAEFYKTDQDENILNCQNEDAIVLKDKTEKPTTDDHEISSAEVMAHSPNHVTVDNQNMADKEPEKQKNTSESLELRLEETPDLANSSCLESSQTQPKSKRELKLEALRKEYGEQFEKTLNTTPRLGSENDEFFSPQNDISIGAAKLFNTFVTHVKASGHTPNILDVDETEINVVVKEKDSEGKDILKVETINIEQNIKRRHLVPNKKKMNLQEMKKQLKKEVLAKRLQEMKRKSEISKLNTEEYDELPPDEIDGNEGNEEDEEYEYEEDEYDEEDEQDSELEEDVNIKEKSSNRNAFLDDEAGESDDQSDDESEPESLNLIQDEHHQQQSECKKSLEFKKIEKSELLSEDENNSHQFDTPNLETASVHSLAGSTVSSASSIFNSAPRWTPFKDRIHNDDDSKKNAVSLVVDENKSPTVSQMTKKRLGFEDLCDDNDPDVDDIDDIVGLCSGKFATQISPSVTTDTLQSQFTQGVSESEHIAKFAEKCHQSTETQDTLILTGNSDRAMSISEDKLSDIDSLPDNSAADESKTVYPPLFEDLPEERQETGMRIVDSDDDEQPEKRSKKRKRILISDDEDESSDDEHVTNNPDQVDEDITSDYDEQEDKIVQDKGMFDKNGRLKKNFFDAEAELSGSEDEFSDDEDEKGLDRLELEEGDYDEIDENEERDKIGRVYQKNQLDEDQAELRLFQERFLEDGDLHSENKRQRQFKWKGLDESLELGRRDSDGEEDGEDVAEQHEQYRIQRLEREKWLKENSENLTDVAPESQFFKISAKVTSNCVSTVASLTRQPSISSGPLQPLNMMKTEQRSSFLSRGQASLDSLSLFAKKVDDRSGTGAKKGRNFVFTAISPEKQTSDETARTSENQSETNAPELKLKPLNPAKKQKLDRSLGSVTRPTIFNLL